LVLWCCCGVLPAVVFVALCASCGVLGAAVCGGGPGVVHGVVLCAWCGVLCVVWCACCGVGCLVRCGVLGVVW